VRGYLPGLFTDAAPAEAVEEALAMMLDARPAGMRPMLLGFAEADLHARIPGSRSAVLPGVGHQCDMEAPERFNAEVRAFLRSVRC
jgi:pimeloyl-ACP methyl ester carboxylesterase